MSTRLDPSQRAAALAALGRDQYDLLVIGGGVVGAGAALDAAARGLSVALVEARDFAAGTSSRSSKLVHGGLRYLEQRDFTLVREALRERHLLLQRLAPHLVRPVPFLYPLHHRLWERAYVGAGVLLYDTLGGARVMPRHRHFSARRTQRLAAALDPRHVTGAVGYFDATVDDARLTMMLARSAAGHGATVLTRTEVVALHRNDSGRVTGATVHDHETGQQRRVNAHRTISATGVWTDQLQQLAGVSGQFEVQASKGIHLLVPRERLPLSTALIMRTEKSVLLVIPWGRHWIIGTTDTPYHDQLTHPVATAQDVQYLLDRLNAVLREPLTAADIDGVYAGLRPLVARVAADTTQLSREHAVGEPAPGLFVIAGGKFTTYRVMAADVVNAATADLGRVVPPSPTARLPVLGAVGYHELWAARDTVAGQQALSPPVVAHLLHRYGSLVGDLFALIEQDPSLAEPIPGAQQHLRVEACYAASHEGALHLDDVLTRRLRVSMETRDGGHAAAPHVAELIAPLLGWDRQRQRAEVDDFRQWLAAERAAQAAVSDAPMARESGRPAASAGRKPTGHAR